MSDFSEDPPPTRATYIAHTTLVLLTNRYTQAHVRLLSPVDGRRLLWAASPIRTEYEEVRQVARGEADPLQHSDAYVEEAVDELLQAALDDETSIEANVEDLLNCLRTPLTTHVYVPLDGIMIDVPELAIASVHLLRMDEEAYNRRIVEPYANVVRDNPHYAEIDGLRFIEMHRERFADLIGRTLIAIRTNTDLRLAFDDLDDTVGTVCDFLQFCLAVLAPRRPENPVRWSTGTNSGRRLSFGWSEGSRPRTLSTAHNESGWPAVRLDDSSVERLSEAGLLVFGAELEGEPTSEYRLLQRRAVRWFAVGERQRHPDDRILAYVTAVDLFFSQPPGTKDGLGVTRRFCHGAAYAITNSPQEASRYARRFVRVYRSRSVTSHEGLFDLADHDDVDSFRNVALRVLSRMGAQPFTSKQNVAEWMAQRRAALSGDERVDMDDATRAAAIDEDDALVELIAMLRLQSRGTFVGIGREAYVLSRLLTDAYRSRTHLRQLRPFARRLYDAADAARLSESDIAPTVLAILNELDWVATAFHERVDSDFS